MLSDAFYQGVGETIEFVAEGVIVEDFVVDIVERKHDGYALAVEVFGQLRFVDAVAFAGEPFDTVAIDGVVEFLF